MQAAYELSNQASVIHLVDLFRSLRNRALRQFARVNRREYKSRIPSDFLVVKRFGMVNKSKGRPNAN